MQINQDQARRFLLYKQGLYGPYRFERKEGIIAYIKQAGCIQYDPVDVCGRNADLTLQSRVLNYRKQDLFKLLYHERALVDGFDKNMSIYHRDDWNHLAVHRQRVTNSQSAYYQKLADEVETTLEFLKDHEFVDNLKLENDTKVHWGYGTANKSRAILDYLFYRGDLIVHHKEGTRRFFALRDRYFPEDEIVFEHEAAMHDWFLKRRIGAIGMLWSRPSDAWLGIVNFKLPQRQAAFQRLLEKGEIVEIHVDEQATPFYILQEDVIMLEAMEQVPKTARLHFMAPLDPLLWDRKLIQALFGFAYTWEIYTPAHKRQYGHYVLPVLYRDRFIGRVEFARDKGVLQCVNIWMEPKQKLPKRFFEASAKRFAKFNGCIYRSIEE